MATNANARLVKLAISAASVAAIAGLTGRIAGEPGQAPAGEDQAAGTGAGAYVQGPPRNGYDGADHDDDDGWDDDHDDHDGWDDDHDDDDGDWDDDHDGDDWEEAVDVVRGQLWFEPGPEGQQTRVSPRTRTRHS